MKAITIKGVTLPDGWTLEQLNSRDDALLLGSAAPLRLFATIDTKRRVFRGGMSTHGKSVNGIRYGGRNWRVRLLDDAVAWLRSIEGAA
jgi:hypothetical protein